jgi:ribose/xylose/arabinose/galactoside ABC-type transport system permease subunit
MDKLSNIMTLGSMRQMKKLISNHNYFLILIGLLIAAIAIMTLVNPNFLSIPYAKNTLKFVSEIGFISLGMALVFLIGGIDLSVGSIVALSAVLLGILSQANVHPAISIVIVLVTGCLCGTLNGVIIAKLKIPALIVTLGTQLVFRGIAIGVTTARAFKVPRELYFIGQSEFMGIPTQFWFLTAALLIVYFLVYHTNKGIRLIAMGYNNEAASFSGINLFKETVNVYLLSGLFSAIAGIIFTCRVTSARSDYGLNYELDAITIAVFGGASFTGGVISIHGTLVAALIIQIVRQGLTAALVPMEVQTVVVGSILIISMLINGSIIRKRSKSVR